MLVPISNVPRDYAWGSTTLLAALQNREPTGVPEAEIWFGDHPGAPARVADAGLPLDEWLAARHEPPLPFLLKLLAAAAPLSIQVHPSKAQAQEGFAREDAAGIDRAAAHRNYRDDNHKPELIVAVSERFEALAGVRELSETLRLLDRMGERPGIRTLAQRLRTGEPAAAVADVLAWLLSGEADQTVSDVVAGAAEADSGAFAGEFAVTARLAQAYPGDPGIVVALLMNYVQLGRGEAIFVGAGVLHAYLSGLGVELMAASDNVLRGGLTPKHIDVPQLLSIVDTTPQRPPLLVPTPVAEGIDRFDVGIPDFALSRVHAGGVAAEVAVAGPSIALATEGTPVVTAADGRVELMPGTAVFATSDEGSLTVSGEGTVFVASRGR